MPMAFVLRWNIAGWLHKGSAENCPFAVGQTIFKVIKERYESKAIEVKQ